jgi:uncharacterized protein (UPF0264 family)
VLGEIGNGPPLLGLTVRSDGLPNSSIRPCTGLCRCRPAFYYFGNQPMTRLLVSVRNTQEARIALDAGVHLIDVKEPDRGPLGRADSSTIASVLRVVARRVPVSAALGELGDANQQPNLTVPPGITYAKIGLASWGKQEIWKSRLLEAFRQLHPAICPVAVAYADWQVCSAPPPKAILTCASRLGCRAILVDTFQKSSGGLLEKWPVEDLADYVASARSQRMLVVLAGSLTPRAISQVLAVEPDYVGVRGAVCRNGRSGILDAAPIREIRRLLDDCSGRRVRATA